MDKIRSHVLQFLPSEKKIIEFSTKTRLNLSIYKRKINLDKLDKIEQNAEIGHYGHYGQNWTLWTKLENFISTTLLLCV